METYGGKLLHVISTECDNFADEYFKLIRWRLRIFMGEDFSAGLINLNSWDLIKIETIT